MTLLIVLQRHFQFTIIILIFKSSQITPENLMISASKNDVSLLCDMCDIIWERERERERERGGRHFEGIIVYTEKNIY